MSTPSHRLATAQTTAFVVVMASLGVVAAVSARSFKPPRDIGIINGGMAHAFETHYDAVFPAKRIGVNLWAFLEYRLLGEGLPGVVIGRNGWLYSDEEFKVAENYQAQLRLNLALIKKVRQQLDAAGVALAICLVPAKARVYPEFLASRKPAQTHAALYDIGLARLAAEGIVAVDLRAALTLGKQQQPTYFRTDTHWTGWGASLAAARVGEVLRAEGLAGPAAATYQTHLASESLHRGDLLNFLPLEPYFARSMPRTEPIEVMVTGAIDRGVAGKPVSAGDLFGDTALPQVVLVGTSYSANALWNFAGYLKESLGEDIGNYAKEGVGPFRPMTAYLASEDFRLRPVHLVIWEIPERALIMAAAPE